MSSYDDDDEDDDIETPLSVIIINSLTVAVGTAVGAIAYNLHQRNKEFGVLKNSQGKVLTNSAETSVTSVLLFIAIFFVTTGVIGFIIIVFPNKLMIVLSKISTGLTMFALLISIALVLLIQHYSKTVFMEKLHELQSSYYISEYDLYKFQKAGASSFVAVTSYINYLQIKNKCCGILKHLDVKESESYKTSFKLKYPNNIAIPYSCCEVHDDNITLIDYRVDRYPMIREYIKDCQCAVKERQKYMHKKPCNEVTMTFVPVHFYVIIGICTCYQIIAFCLTKSYYNDLEE